MQQVKAKKNLGQHFLTDLSVAQRIADTLLDYRETPVLEIGPGMGVLTQYLIADGHDLKVVELDTESVEYLNEHYPELDGRIISADFLKLNLTEIFGDREFKTLRRASEWRPCSPMSIVTKSLPGAMNGRSRISCNS